MYSCYRSKLRRRKRRKPRHSLSRHPRPHPGRRILATHIPTVTATLLSITTAAPIHLLAAVEATTTTRLHILTPRRRVPVHREEDLQDHQGRLRLPTDGHLLIQVCCVAVVI